MQVGDAVVSRILRSQSHRLLSANVAVLRYSERRSGRQFVMPVQCVARDDGVVVLAGRAESKSWWRNLAVPRGLGYLTAGRWRRTSARVVGGSDERVDATRWLAAHA